MSDVTELKAVDVLNDYVAVLKILDVPDGFEVDQAAASRMSNEGIVVGVGPDANGIVELGDRVIISKKQYLAICPASGGYEGQIVVMARKLDMIVRVGKSDEHKFVDG